MRAKQNKRKKLLAILLSLVTLISVGYAMISSDLSIIGNALFKSKRWNVYFTNVEQSTGSVTPSIAPTTNGTSTTTLTWAVSMDTPGQFYEFTVDAVNGGTLDAMINTAPNSIVTSSLTEEQRKYIDYKVIYRDGAEIQQYDKLSAGTTEKLKVRVEFKKDIEEEDLPQTVQEITFTYTSNYVQADGRAKARESGRGAPIVIGGPVKRGDRVNYNPGTLTSNDIQLPTVTSASASASSTASGNGSNVIPCAELTGTINASDATNWVVLDVTDDGEVLLIPNTYSNVRLKLKGIIGYNNAIESLDTVASIYKNPTYASYARSLTVEDVNRVTGYGVTQYATGSATSTGTATASGAATATASEYGFATSSSTASGGSKIYSFTNRYGMDTDLNIVDYGSQGERTFVSTAETRNYSYSIDSTNVLTNKYGWLASRCIDLHSTSCNFKVRVLEGWNMYNRNIVWLADGGNNNEYYSTEKVIPVISVKSTVQMQKDEDGVWQLSDGGKVRVTFDKNDENATGTMEEQEFTFGQAANLTANSFTRTGYTFIGWNTKADGTGTSYTNEQSVTLLGDLILYAQWGYYISFDANGGTGTMDDQILQCGKTEALTSNSYTKSGFHFTGWNTEADGSGISYTNGQSIIDLGDITLYAQWEVNTFNIVFNHNGGSGRMVNMKNITSGVPTVLTENSYARTGYTFAGWNTEADGSGISYEDMQSIVYFADMNEENITLYAQWTGNTYTVVFDANGGTGTMEDQTMIYGSTTQLASNGFTKAEYGFVGWNTEADGSGTKYTNNQSVNNLTTENGAIITLYAQWGIVKYAVQIYGINQDVDANDQTLGLTFGPAVGDNYNNAYVTHRYEETEAGSGIYNVIIEKYTVASDGTPTLASSTTLTDSNSNNVTRTQAQVTARENISLHDMTWTEIAAVSDKTVFEDCMLCGDTKSVKLALNDTIGTGSVYSQYGDGAGALCYTIKNTTGAYYGNWNPSKTQNSYVGTGVTLDSNETSYGSNARNAGGYSVSHIRATLIGKNSKTNKGYAGDVNLTDDTCLYSCIESDLQAVITPKKIKYVTGTSNSSYTLNDDIADSIWLFSDREMYGTGQDSGNTTEGLGASGDGYNKFGNTESKYYISSYNTSNNTKRVARTEAGSVSFWWLRSPDLSNTYISRVVNAYGIIYGSVSDDGANSVSGLGFGFCIK